MNGLMKCTINSGLFRDEVVITVGESIFFIHKANILEGKLKVAIKGEVEGGILVYLSGASLVVKSEDLEYS